ncbi:glycosyltransferase family 2 protein, partial [Candidatus Omnitrophota bacterium]
DDGSKDRSFEVLDQIFKEDKRAKVIRFTKNFGKSSALTAGFGASSGEYLITMDADLQDDPEEIVNYLKKLKEGNDLVCGWRASREDPLFKKIASQLFNGFVNLVSGTSFHDINCGMKGYRRSVIADLNLHGSLYRFIPVIANERGFKIGEIPVRHHHRKFSKSKYGSRRYVEGFIDIFTVFFLTRYMRKPLHFMGFWGLLSFLLGVVINVYLTVIWLQGVRPIGNRPLFFLGILLIIFGVQLFSIGLIGEMIAANLDKEKREYNVRDRLSK